MKNKAIIPKNIKYTMSILTHLLDLCFFSILTNSEFKKKAMTKAQIKGFNILFNVAKNSSLLTSLKRINAITSKKNILP